MAGSSRHGLLNFFGIGAVVKVKKGALLLDSADFTSIPTTTMLAGRPTRDDRVAGREPARVAALHHAINIFASATFH
jgi:hypothetical protein